tara:strand:- start:210 stop:404 length:195 start_codon:yes stop_codon:yes gene_type:complete
MKRSFLDELKLEAKAQGLHFEKGGVSYGKRGWTLYRGKSEIAECSDLDAIKSVINWQREIRGKK